MSEPHYLKELNPEQKAAVIQTDGPIMIVAGAGSGKTRVLTYRIAHLIASGVDPFNILSLTFTNKAAREMRHRIEKVVGLEARNIWMGTFHSVFAKILRIEADKIGYPQNFTIYDSDDSKSLIKSIVKEMNLDEKIYKPNAVLSRISNAKNNLIQAHVYQNQPDLIAYDETTGKGKIHAIYTEYAKRCFRSGAMDFDDLLLNTFKLLNNFPDVLHKYQHKFKYVMVDEYQDTNHCQYMIIKKLASVFENICVVGDDAQSIYSFRGATIKNILNFEKDYPDLSIFKLEQNYRSTETIVNAANSVIAKNQDQIKKKVWTENTTGNKIKIIRAVTDNEEGKMIAQNIFETKMSEQKMNSDFAILYRTNSQSRSLEEALRKLNIPYRIYGGMSFYQRKEIKDILAYLRLIINQADSEALKRIINYPARGIGKTSLDRIGVIASNEDKTLWEVILNAENYPQIKGVSKKLKNFVEMIQSFIKLTSQQNAYEIAMHVARTTNLLKMLNEDKTIEGINKYENMVELLNGLKEFVEDDTNESEKNLGSYMQDIALLTDSDKEDDDNDRVSLMTIHQSKGLEFSKVYVSGLEENLFPSQMALANRSELEEERRLFYVAITRAEQNLALSFATSRFRFGNLLPCEPSRFIDEIDNEFLEFTKSTVVKSKESRNSNSSFLGKIDEPSSLKRTIARQNKPKMLRPPATENFVAEDLSNISIEMKIEHQRFGFGTIKKIEPIENPEKVTIIFDDFGEKTLVLKFAKLRRA
ncbi:MAG: UvrD-helicase domain-containing protein [Bacteroidia bacterium]|nr:UvrD-helicase domain-containing protein [Bacteroidia bacterium]